MEAAEAQLTASVQVLEPQWFRVVPAGHIAQAQTEALSTVRLAVRVLPWPMWNSKARALNPRAIWLKRGVCFFPTGQTCSSLARLPAFLSFCKCPRASIPGPLQSASLLPRAAASLSQWPVLLQEVPSGPTVHPIPGVCHRIVEPGSWKGPKRARPTPSFDR